MSAAKNKIDFSPLNLLHGSLNEISIIFPSFLCVSLREFPIKIMLHFAAVYIAQKISFAYSSHLHKSHQQNTKILLIYITLYKLLTFPMAFEIVSKIVLALSMYSTVSEKAKSIRREQRFKNASACARIYGKDVHRRKENE
jgi:hypothetical protein